MIEGHFPSAKLDYYNQTNIWIIYQDFVSIQNASLFENMGIDAESCRLPGWSAAVYIELVGKFCKWCILFNRFCYNI